MECALGAINALFENRSEIRTGDFQQFFKGQTIFGVRCISCVVEPDFRRDRNPAKLTITVLFHLRFGF